jgi:MFS transporter, DHA1 family, multidrug resistance protein
MTRRAGTPCRRSFNDVMSVEAVATPTRRGNAYLVALLGLLTAVDAIAIDILIPAMPQLQRAFSISAAEASATISFFMVGLIVGQFVHGPASDRFGRRPQLIAGFVLFILGTTLPVLWHSLQSLLAGRLLQGFGASAGMVVSRAVVVDRFPPASRAQIFSILMQILGLATIVAPVLGGYLASNRGWESIFITLDVLGAVCLCLVVMCLAETRASGSEAISFRSQGRDAWELLTDRAFIVYCLSAGCVMAGMFATLVGNAFIFVNEFHWTPMAYSLVSAVGSLAFVLVGFLNGLALRRYTPVQVLDWGMGAVALTAALFWIAAATGSASPTYVAVLTMSQWALLGFVFGNIGALAMNRAQRAAGTGSSLFGISQYTFGAIAAPAAALVGGSALHSTSVTGAVFYFVALALIVLGRWRRDRIHTP